MAARIRAVAMVRKIRDRQASVLAGKSPGDVVAFFREAGKAAMRDVQRRSKTPRRRAS